MFEELLRRLDHIELDADHIPWRRGNFVLGPNSVPVTFTAR
jgi:cytochrome P450